MKNYVFSFLYSFLLLSAKVHSWHGFDNVVYHCWEIATASATNWQPINPATCVGVHLRWIVPPPTDVKAEQSFDTTYELTLDSTFYNWAAPADYFSSANGSGITDGTAAKNWCENTVCPTDTSQATAINCCIHHVNVHSCPLSSITNLCGPWIPHDGQVFSHSDVLVGSVTLGNWTSNVPGFHEVGLTSVIAHFKVADLHLALEIEINVSPKTVCGDGNCESTEGEDCESCPKDCGVCPLKGWQIGLIAAVAILIVAGIIAVVIYFQYQKRKFLFDESWIVPYEKVKEDDDLRGAFGSMISMSVGSQSDIGTASNMALSAMRKQKFAKTAFLDGKTVAVRKIRKKEFSLTKAIRWEVKTAREMDHHNLCKFAGGCIEVPNVCILSEYCPKGSLSDVLLNDEVPLNWAFRFSFATDIARGMTYLHSHKVYHGRLKSNNCVVDDRWTIKISDYGLQTYRKSDELLNDDDEDDEDDDEDGGNYYQEQRVRVYKAPEFRGMAVYEPTPAGDVYAFSIILLEIAVRNDPYGDEDPFLVPEDFKPDLPDLSPEMCDEPDSACPCPSEYLHLIEECWHEEPHKRPGFDFAKKTLQRINPNKLSPIDLMMAMMEKYSKHLESIVSERTQELVVEKQKTDRLLYSMLPRAVADDLKHGKTIDAENFDGCTIYFSDIVGFTNLSAGSTPMQVVALLNHLYITFDEIIDRYDVYKVETIGDAYMVVSGIPIRTPFHAREVGNMALDLIAACKVFVIPHKPGEPLKVRVGLHSGSACAGVVGLKMPRYCLFGDTVNTASRMESNGEAYKVHISNYTYEELVKLGGYKMELRGTLPIKGKGEMKTWWLHGHDDNYESIHGTKDKSKVLKEGGQDMKKSRQSLSKIYDKSTTSLKENIKEILETVPNGTGDLFTPVELPDADVGKRKISQLSSSNDSGYNERNGDDDSPDVHEIRVQSLESLKDVTDEKENENQKE